MSEEQKSGLEINQSIDRAESYVRENKKSLSIIGLSILGVVLAYLGYNQFIVKPQEEQAQQEMFIAEQYFGQDSTNLAINGDGSYPGFQEIVDNYGSAPSGNLAQYYLGMSLLKKGDYQAAIDALKSYDAEDDITGALALGAIGGAYLELGNNDEAASYFDKAVSYDENNFTTPLFLMKKAFVLEMNKDYNGSLEIYNRIKADYPFSTEAREIEKYIGRAEAMTTSSN
ncbi:MAG: tetratricopeptide repeat protein [Sphingobacteriales bacterium]|jgi:tetratricopeptide (TPR) repeat protein|nr:tetratricopeptide repeat protein [Sphingobacteriales bacterium]